ncbi:hypothetical protein SAMN06265827_11059 [Orenia metallireducens]|uniref:Uncharacterized protein n=1 Tax=Orenia metallireducens TaxID=1413210 RepID=A0A285GTP6_9FIRM|nr:hypothetical protein [Orenia metallireducens]SNY26828.1 hypothetical protein SAMN06265827_11059 [Orenia metallireducens]
MKKIKTLADLKKLHKEGDIKEEILNYLESYFYKLAESLGNNVAPEEFSLEEHGYFVLLENDNDLQLAKLKEVGLIEGLFNCRFEFVEEIKLDNISLHKVSVLYDNDYMMMFFIEAKEFSQEVQEWLKENSDTIEYGDIEDVPF